MATKAGVWIDHAKAIVVLLADQGEEVKRIKSDIKKPARTATGARMKNSYTPNDFVAEDRQDRKVTAHLNTYYDEVIACIRNAEAIVILGPGEAKGELKKRIKSKKLRASVADLETADKMTDRQVAITVREHFETAPRQGSHESDRKRPVESGRSE
jgi:stalled ribosome rescue protein Dom34